MNIGEMENTEHYQLTVAYDDCVKRMAQLDKKISRFKKILILVSLLMLILCII